MVKAKSLNVRLVQQGFMQQDGKLFVQIGVTPPFAQVVRFNGRCYLLNGYHRTVGAAQAGATHIPCIFRDVASALEAGVNPPETFPLGLLESNNPPTLGHFANGLAYAAQLKSVSRYMHVSWDEHVIPDE